MYSFSYIKLIKNTHFSQNNLKKSAAKFHSRRMHRNGSQPEAWCLVSLNLQRTERTDLRVVVAWDRWTLGKRIDLGHSLWLCKNIVLSHSGKRRSSLSSCWLSEHGLLGAESWDLRKWALCRGRGCAAESALAKGRRCRSRRGEQSRGWSSLLSENRASHRRCLRCLTK